MGEKKKKDRVLRDLARSYLGQCTSRSVRPMGTKTNIDTNMEWEKFIEFYFEMGIF